MKTTKTTLFALYYSLSMFQVLQDPFVLVYDDSLCVSHFNVKKSSRLVSKHAAQ